jgi:hypothetical protein
MHSRWINGWGIWGCVIVLPESPVTIPHYKIYKGNVFFYSAIILIMWSYDHRPGKMEQPAQPRRSARIESRNAQRPNAIPAKVSCTTPHPTETRRDEYGVAEQDMVGKEDDDQDEDEGEEDDEHEHEHEEEDKGEEEKECDGEKVAPTSSTKIEPDVDYDECVVCMDARPNTITLPCGCTAICQKCSMLLKGAHAEACLLCQRKIDCLLVDVTSC